MRASWVFAKWASSVAGSGAMVISTALAGAIRSGGGAAGLAVPIASKARQQMMLRDMAGPRVPTDGDSATDDITRGPELRKACRLTCRTGERGPINGGDAPAA